jgi:hypothetical protein
MASLYGADFTLDTTTPATVGTRAAQAVLDYRHHDGANQLGDEPDKITGVPSGVAYSDYTGYRPANTWDKITNPDRWCPASRI